MTKDEALRMAIEAMNSSYSSQGYPARAAWLYHGCDVKLFKALQACKEALEPTVAELNDEYLRDTHVEGMPKDGDCCTEGCIKCDARKVLTETQHWLCLDGQMVVAQLYNLVEILNDPMRAYPHNFSTPAKGNALLFGLCQEAADEIELLKAKLRELDNA